MEFEAVTNSYGNINDTSRHDTFEKLRNILRSELEKYKSDGGCRKFDIGYIQGSLTISKSFLSNTFY